MAQGTQVHIAAWPGMGTSRHLFLSRAFASQAAAYVIDVGGVLTPDRVSDKYKEIDSSFPGESCIIDPRGEVLAGPAEGEDILIAECSTEHIYSAKAVCDVAGHYSRPDVFRLSVNRNMHRRVVEMQEEDFEPTLSETSTEK
jgi:predicted amidohydrolase